MNDLDRLYQATGGSLLSGCMPESVLAFLGGLVRLYKPDVVIQTGHLWGRSALAILRAIEKQDYPEIWSGDSKFTEFVQKHTPTPRNPVLISIDPAPAGVPHWEDGVKILRVHYGETFRYVRGLSGDYFREVDPDEFKGKRLMGVVDGDHTPTGCLVDLNGLHSLGAELIFLDDTEWLPGLREVGTEFASLHGYSTFSMPESEGVMVLRR